MAKIACLGILVADVVGKTISQFPAKGTLAAVDRMELHAGGCAANTGITLAKLGVPTAVLGRAGQDGFGDFLVQSLERAGVDTSGLVRGGSEATSATMVAVDADGERTFLHYRGANAIFRQDDVAWDVIEAADLLHLAGPFLMTEFMGDECAAVLKRAKAMGKTTVLDTVWDPTERWMAALEPSLPHLDYLLPSYDEARLLTGESEPEAIAQVFLDRGVRVVGLKLGERGAYVRAAGESGFAVPPLRVQAVDALGAGDAWVAGYLCGVTQGWDLARTARFANTVGSCAVQALGATAGIRSFEETCALAFGEAGGLPGTAP